MGLAWRQRRQRLSELLKTHNSPLGEADAIHDAIDAASVVGLSPEVQKLTFGVSDLVVVSALEKGQFGVVEVVQCRLNNAVYARKKIQKSTAQKFRDHCFVQSERDLLLKATLTDTPWAPHLLCAFQTDDQLHLVMDYAEGGNLWNVLESAVDNRLLEDELRWWVPQAVSAIGWCHSQGFAHRDIKPHNFVLTRQARLQLIDFGCAAPLLPSSTSRRAIPKPYCLVPCGTCDYISPEILQAHEDALFAAEMDQDVDASMREEGYGCETDWWSLGAVIYELAVGTAPFFAPDIKQTYSLIVQHERSMISFDPALNLCNAFKNLVRCLLSSADERLGRGGITQIQQHTWFSSTQWQTLHFQHPPPSLMLPTITGPNLNSIIDEASFDDERSSPFDFSHLFKSTPGSSRFQDSTAGQRPPIPTPNAFPGFSWGPAPNAFDDMPSDEPSNKAIPDFTPLRNVQNSQRMFSSRTTPSTVASRPLDRALFDTRFSDPGAPLNRFTTPVRPAMTPHAQSTIPRTGGFGFPGSGTGSTRPTRIVSDREALRQMINCVSASARKKVLESGRKPRFISTLRRPSTALSAQHQQQKERPKIPSLQLAHEPTVTAGMMTMTGTGTEGTIIINLPIANPRRELNASESMDESAPPSPSPRPGSSMSRRSGSQSPYPFSRSAAPSPMLEPPGSATGTWNSMTLPSSVMGRNFSTGVGGIRRARSRSGSGTFTLPLRSAASASHTHPKAIPASPSFPSLPPPTPAPAPAPTPRRVRAVTFSPPSPPPASPPAPPSIPSSVSISVLAPSPHPARLRLRPKPKLQPMSQSTPKPKSTKPPRASSNPNTNPSSTSTSTTAISATATNTASLSTAASSKLIDPLDALDSHLDMLFGELGRVENELRRLKDFVFVTGQEV